VPANALLRLVAHPLAVGAHVGGQTGRALPAELLPGEPGEHGRATGELGRDLDQGLVDQHGDRVEVGRVRLQTETLGLERDRAAAGERVEDRRRVSARRRQDLRMRLGEQRLVARVLPDHEPLDDAVQALALDALRIVGREAIGMRGGVVDELGEQHRAGGRERPSRPPQVQRRRVAVTDRLLARRFAVDRL